MAPPSATDSPDDDDANAAVAGGAADADPASTSGLVLGGKPTANSPATITNGHGLEPLSIIAARPTDVPPATVREVQAPPAVRGFRLIVVRGERLGQEYPLLPGKNFIGRSTPEKPADIDLTSQERAEQVWASRQHAVVALDGGVPTLEDLNSLNGTFVNRVRLYPGQRATLRPGDVVQVGTVQMRLDG